jgi:trehalose 6-phosphate phosphatase
MTPLFPESGLDNFNGIVKPGLLCAFDFDGTLAPIVTQPESATLPVELGHRLVQLSAYAPVAIITGRALADIRARLGFKPDFIVGNHGIEGLPGWEQRAGNYRRLSGIWREALAAEIAAASDPGIRIEDKHYSLSIHYRLARDPAQAESWLKELFARLDSPPHVISGKYVFNLLPEYAGDKGTALERLMQISGARSVIYVGDDVTDEDVFKLRRNDLLSIRIEHASDSAAEFYLPQRQDMSNLLDELIERLRALGASNWVSLESTANT